MAVRRRVAARTPARRGAVTDVLDDFLPTARPPAPVRESAGERRVLVRRTLAAAIDLVICYLLLEVPVIYALSVAFPAEYEAIGPSAVVFSVLYLLPVWSTYSFAFEWRFARTPGKVNRGLMVVDADGAPPSLRASVVRNLARYVDVLGVPPAVVGTLLPLATGGRRVGDLLADTDVVRVQAPSAESVVAEADREGWEQALEETAADENEWS